VSNRSLLSPHLPRASQYFIRFVPPVYLAIISLSIYLAPLRGSLSPSDAMHIITLRTSYYQDYNDDKRGAGWHRSS